jgi:hypothetical protein
MIAKEFRALLPLWGACVAAMILGPAIGRQLAPIAVLAFFFGSAAIGAWSIGHEYSHRTLGMLLTLPTPRSRIWLSKLAVSGTMLVTISLLALYVFPRDARLPYGIATYFLPALVSLFVASWLTMATRSAAAGAYFTASISAILMLIGAWIGTRKYGYTREVDVFQLKFLWWTLSAVSAIAAVHGWRMFGRLQAIDGRGKAIHLGLWRRDGQVSPTAVRHDVYWLLIKKELRLQQLAWVVAMIYAGIYITVLVLRRGQRDLIDSFATMTAVIYGLVQSLLIGALASAEDRHTGAHDSQLLLPLSSARQWMVKAGTAIAHAQIVTLALPILLVLLLPVEGLTPFGRHSPIQPSMIAMVAALTCISLYVSTITTSGLRALMLSIPTVFAVIWFVQRIQIPVTWAAYRFVWEGGSGPMVARTPLVSPELFIPVGALVIAGVVLWRALPHYRWTDRNMPRVAGDAALLAVGLVAYFALAGAVGLR